MDHKSLRQRCEAKLAELDLASFENARSFCLTLAARRGRPILIQPATNPAGPFGLWVAGASADVIFYEQGTSPLHQEHIILHEACHLLWEHRPVPVSDGELAHLLFPDIRPDVVQRVLQRFGYSTTEEQEAEMLASLILERTAGALTPSSSVLDAESEALLRRLRASLEETTSGQA